MKGKICMITGANSGIGKATAIGLAKMGATIVMVSRNKMRGEKALEDIKKDCGNGGVDLMLADLSKQKEVVQLVKDFKEKYQELHVLINNAGVNLSKRVLTEDGIETTFAINYLAPFLLCNLLLDILQKSGPSRILNVASSVQAKSINFENLNGEKHYRQLNAYGQSKLAMVLFTYEFARKIEGTGVTVNCLHPGYVKTNMVRKFRKFVKYFYPLIGLFMRSPKKGAKTSIYLASSPEVEGISGKYFKKRKLEKSVEASYDEELAKRVWDVSVDLTNHHLE
jgi:NAD(P)-dependent dehydrogenase (short-subunit alcohol dehydrogenase family)